MIPIPIRIRTDMPEDLAWIITKKRGRLVVYLARNIPAELEQEYVRQAVKAWCRRHGWILGLPPVLAAGGAGLGWLIRQFRRPALAAGTAVTTVAGVALAAVTLTDPPHHPAPHRPPAAAAPPSKPAPRTPSHRPRATPPHTTKPDLPAATERPEPAASSSSRGVAVDEVGRVRVPPVRVRPPVTVPTPPVVPTVRPTRQGCRLAQVEVGKLVRVCL